MSTANKLTKTNGFPIMETGLDDHILNDEEAMAVLRAQTGMAMLGKGEIQGLANLGIYTRGVGILRTQRGQVAVSQAFLRNAAKILNSRLIKEDARGTKARPDAVTKHAQALANVIAVLNDSQTLALNLEKVAAPTGKPDDIEPPRNTGFGTGPVIAAQQVHIHESKKELPKDWSAV